MSAYVKGIRFDGAQEAAIVTVWPDGPDAMALVALAAMTGDVGKWAVVGREGDDVYCVRRPHGPRREGWVL